MVTVGVLARFEFKDGNESAAENFFASGRDVVEQQPASTVWFAFRLGLREYGAFAAFANEGDREALLSSGGPKISAQNAELFVRPPSFELVDIVAARQQGGHR
jgi:hypothetical protein